MGNIYDSSKLILATQANVDIETSWMEGYEKSKHSVIDPELHNPYPENTKQYQYWLDGYNTGLMNEAALFPNYSISNNEVYEQPKNHKFFVEAIIALTIIFAGFLIYDLVS